MSVEKDAEVASRLLAVVDLLSGQFGVDVPGALRSISGSRSERNFARLEAATLFLEGFALEVFCVGASSKLSGYTSVDVIRNTDNEDLQAEGLSESEVASIKTAFERETNVEVEGRTKLVRGRRKKEDTKDAGGDDQASSIANGSEG